MERSIARQVRSGQISLAATRARGGPLQTHTHNLPGTGMQAPSRPMRLDSGHCSMICGWRRDTACRFSTEHLAAIWPLVHCRLLHTDVWRAAPAGTIAGHTHTQFLAAEELSHLCARTGQADRLKGRPAAPGAVRPSGRCPAPGDRPRLVLHPVMPCSAGSLAMAGRLVGDRLSFASTPGSGASC